MYIILDLSEFPFEIKVVCDESDPAKPILFDESSEAEEYGERTLGEYQVVLLEE